MARALITGCSSGFGRATAIELAARGHEVVASARREDALDDLDVAARLQLDVTDPDSVDSALAAAGAVDVLVNNAGWSVSGPVEAVPLHDAARMFEVNFWGAVRLIQLVVPGMRDRGGGVIVNLSSIAGRLAQPLGGFYAASKHALEAVSEALSYEVGAFGIVTVIVEPGWFDTSFRDNSRRFGTEEPPYDEVERIWSGIDTALVGEARPPAGVVASVIADTVEAALRGEEVPLRVPVGADAELVLPIRRQLDDPAFEATMRGHLGIHEWTRTPPRLH